MDGGRCLAAVYTCLLMSSCVDRVAAATVRRMGAGLLLEEFATGTAPAACSALASGTFLYVALMEVIPNELQHKENTAMKISTMVLGFSLMSILAKWA